MLIFFIARRICQIILHLHSEHLSVRMFLIKIILPFIIAVAIKLVGPPITAHILNIGNFIFQVFAHFAAAMELQNEVQGHMKSRTNSQYGKLFKINTEIFFGTIEGWI